MYYKSSQVNKMISNAGVKAHQCMHHSSQLYENNYSTFITHIDLSPVLARSAVKSYLTFSCIQNLTKRALNKY